MKILGRKGQSLGEYALLIGLVIGVIFAMMPYVKDRLAGGIQFGADNYLTTVGGAAYKVDQASESASASGTKFTTADVGTAGATSVGHQKTAN